MNQQVISDPISLTEASIIMNYLQINDSLQKRILKEIQKLNT